MHETQKIWQGTNPEVLLISIVLVTTLLFSPVLSSLLNYTSIPSTGTITGISPLHVDGKYVRDTSNQTIYLRGVWKGAFLDTSTGWWGLDASKWDEAALRQTLGILKQQWRVNVISTEIWGDWWLQNKAVTLTGGTTNIGEKDAIKMTLQIAAQYGIYLQIRLWSPTSSGGRIEGQPYQPYATWTVNDFVNFWANVATELKSYPNAIFTLYDEPTGNMSIWFDSATRAINAIRAAGAEQIVVVHWSYCSDCMWMERWVQEARPLHNIVFSNHIYRYHGTFGYNPNSPVDINYIRNFLSAKPGATYSGAGYKYITDTYNIPIWVSAIGAYEGYSNDEEYVYFRNTLQVLNEWGLGYVAMHADRTALVWTLLTQTGGVFGSPNRVGQALIDAIAGIPVPPTHNLTISSNINGVIFALNGTQESSPFSEIMFEGTYRILMPTSTRIYSHTPLFGNTKIGNGGSIYTYVYTAGPYTINENKTISAINLYVMVSGNAKVALYDEAGGNPNNLIVQSASESCSANTWHSFTLPSTQIRPGNYFLAIKFDTNGMLSSVAKSGFGKYRAQTYSSAFPNPFGTVEGTTGAEYAVYVPASPMQTFTYYFAHWENNSTNYDRTISLSTNMVLNATYQIGP